MDQTRPQDGTSNFTYVENIPSGQVQNNINLHHGQRSHTPINSKELPIDLVSMQSPKQVVVVRNGQQQQQSTVRQQLQVGSNRKQIGIQDVVRQQQFIQQVQQQQVQQQQVQQQPQIYSQQQQQQQQQMVAPKLVHQVDNREEIEHWRISSLNYQRQLMETQQELVRIKSQPPQERITYIEDTQKCVEFEKRVYECSAEIDRLNSILNQTGQELEQWRQRHMQIQQLLQQKQNVELDCERMRIFFQENEKSLQIEIQRLGSAIQQSQGQIALMQQQLVDGQQWEGRFHQQLNESQQLTNELESLNQLLIKKSDDFQQERKLMVQEIENKNSQVVEFQVQIPKVQQGYQNQMRQFQSDCEDRLQQEQRIRVEEVTRLSQITQTLQIALSDTTKYDESEQRAKYQGEEIARLNQLLRQRTDELDKVRQQYNYIQQEMQDMQRYVEYESKYEAAYQENERLCKTIKSKIEENEHLRTCIANLQITLNDNAKLLDYENKIALLSQEIERLHQSLKSRTDEIERNRLQITNLQNDTSQSNNLAIEVSRMNNLIRTKNDEIERYKYTIQNLQNSTIELARMKEVETKLVILSTEVERLTIQLRNKNDEIEQFKKQIIQFQTQMNDNSRLRDLEIKNTTYVNEIERLNHILKIKLGELEQFRQAYVKLEQSNRGENDNQIISMGNELRNMDSKLKESSSRLQQVTNENERLNGSLRKQADEIEGTKRFNTQQSSQLADRQVDKITTLSQELDSWKQQFIILNREYHKNQEQLILSQAELDSFKNKKSSLRESEYLSENISQYKPSNNDRKSQGSTSNFNNYQIGTLTHRNINI